MNPDYKKLLGYAGISALTGAGVAGAYGLSKELYRLLLQDKNIRDAEGKINQAEGTPSLDESTAVEVTPALLEESTAVEDLPPVALAELATQYKSAESQVGALLSSIGDSVSSQASSLWDTIYEEGSGPLMYGVAAPIAMIAPGVLTYHFAKKLIDHNRNKALAAKVQTAKEEFQEALSSKSSSINKRIDDLYYKATKQSTGGPSTVPKITELEPEAHGLGLGPKGLVYALGATTGIAGILAYMALSAKLENNPDKEKAKRLKQLLSADLSAQSAETSVGLTEDALGNKSVKF